MTKNTKQRIKFFGALIDPLTMDETLARITEVIEKREITQHVVINVAKLVYMQKNEELKSAVNSCGLINVDGAGILWGARFLGMDIPERVAGVDLMYNLVSLSAQKGYKVYFFGATSDVMKSMIKKYNDELPNLQIAGFRDGYFREDEEQVIAEGIRASNADILFVGMPSPKKEIFLNMHLDKMNVPFVMGVGGSFDIMAGKTRRAPHWMREKGLEWFYRLIQEPRRMFKRYLVTNAVYSGMLLKEKWRRS